MFGATSKTYLGRLRKTLDDVNVRSRKPGSNKAMPTRWTNNDSLETIYYPKSTRDNDRLRKQAKFHECAQTVDDAFCPSEFAEREPHPIIKGLRSYMASPIDRSTMASATGFRDEKPKRLPKSDKCSTWDDLVATTKRLMRSMCSDARCKSRLQTPEPNGQ